jgi:hypothetical protein
MKNFGQGKMSVFSAVMSGHNDGKWAPRNFSTNLYCSNTRIKARFHGARHDNMERPQLCATLQHIQELPGVVIS